jgi:signal transduction histidine kinase
VNENNTATQNSSGLKKIKRFIFVYRAIFFILGLGAVSILGVLVLFNISSDANVDFITRISIRQSEKAFADIESSTVDMLSAALEGVMINEKSAQLFQSRDREQLYRTIRPLYEHFKKQNDITHWYFINPDRTTFLRVHAPHMHSDNITRITLDRVVATKKPAWGKELGKTALAVRCVHPYYYQGRLIGYMEMAVEIDHFLKRLGQFTGSEYAVLARKEFLDRKKWASAVALKGIPDTWDDLEHYLMVDKTCRDVSNEHITTRIGRLPSIPDEGIVLGKASYHDKHFVRGVFPFFDASGQKSGAVIVLRDITETFSTLQSQRTAILITLIAFMAIVTFFMIFFHRRAERELRKYRFHLEDTVQDATAELKETNRRLNLEIKRHKTVRKALEQECRARVTAEKKQVQAVKQVERSARMASIGVMSAGITHEINQPLNAIKVTADSIRYWDKRNPGKLPETFTDQLNVLSKSVERIVEIIRHMRAFWVVPDSPAIAEIDINIAMGNALSLTRQQLHAHYIQEKVKVSTEPLLVEGNMIHFEQIIINLVVNAIHALDEKEQNQKEIRISAFPDEQEKNAVMIIEDNGPGLPGDDTDKLFDPFFSTHSGSEAMGLGLAIVKRYVDRYKGTIEALNVRDNSGKVSGARFTLKFPIYSGESGNGTDSGEQVQQALKGNTAQGVG